MIERFGNIDPHKLTPLGVIASFEVAIRSLPDILESIGDELLVAIVVLLSEGWLGPLLGELSMWLLYASLLYFLIPRLLSDLMSELSDNRVFRWISAVAMVVIAAGFSSYLAETRTIVSTGDSVGGPEPSTAGIILAPTVCYFFLLVLYLWLARQEPMLGEAGIITKVSNRIGSKEIFPKSKNKANKTRADRIFITFNVILTLVVISILIFVFGGVIGVLSQLYPVPEFIFIGMWLVSSAGRYTSRLQRINIDPTDTDFEGAFGQSIFDTLQSTKGTLGLHIFVGLLGSLLIFFSSVIGLRQSFNRIGIQEDVSGWSGAVPEPLQPFAHYAIVGSTLTLTVSALCLLWGWFRVAKRTPAFVAAWEQRNEDVPGSYPRPDTSRPPYGIIPPILIATTALPALIPEGFSTDNYLFQTAYGVLWPLGIVAAGAWVWATLRHDPQPAISDNWIYGVVFALISTYAGVLSFATGSETSYIALVIFALIGLFLSHSADIALALRRMEHTWSDPRRPVAYFMTILLGALALVTPVNQRLAFAGVGLILVLFIMDFLYEYVYADYTTPMPDKLVREFRSTLNGVEGPVRLLIVERELSKTAKQAVHEAFRERRDQWRALDDDQSVPTVLATGDDPRPWVAVEPTDGRPFTEAREDLSLSEREAVVTSIAETLQRAADAGTVHDGIRPEHIQITQSEEQPEVIIDNWVAEAERDSPYTAAEVRKNPELRTEQTAVYNVAALAYYALAGSSPTTVDDDGETDPDADSPVPPSRHVSELPSAVDTAVFRGLNPEPVSRQQSIAEFRDSFVEAVAAAETNTSFESTADKSDEEYESTTDVSTGTGQQEPILRGGSRQFTRREAVSMVGVSGLGVAGYLYPTLGGANDPHIPDRIEYALHSRTGTLQWTFGTNDSVAYSPAVDNGTVFVGCNDSRVYALDAETGAKEWSVETAGSDASSPTTSDGTVFVPSNGGLYAMDATDGTELWQFDVSILHSPTVVNDTVYVGGDEALAIDAETGSTRWSRDVTNPTPPTVVSGTAYFGSDEGIYAFDTSTGNQEWLSEIGTISWRNGVFGVADNSVFALGATEEDIGRVCAVNAHDGTEEWQFNLEVGLLNIFPDSAAVGDGTVYVGAGNRVYALGTDGRTHWQFDTEYQVTGTSSISDQILYVSTDEESLYAVDVTDGSQDWVLRSGDDGFLNSPTVADNHLYVGSGDTDRVYAVAVSDR